jgi:hypothetical protein
VPAGGLLGAVKKHGFDAYVHVCRFKIQTDTYRYAQNAGVHMCMYSGSKARICMYAGSKYRQIHTDMHRMQECICACIQDQKRVSACMQVQNTDRYIQICTECRRAYVHVFRIRSAYLHVCRIKIQTDTYRYALNA